MSVDGELAHGWVLHPKGRGTFDLVSSCLVTNFLCSWASLFLHIPSDRKRPLAIFLYKSRWMVFTFLFPEVLTGMAAEQWRSARQSVEDFAQLEKHWGSALRVFQASENLEIVQKNLASIKRCPWTMRHAFFADMGGYKLSCPDSRPFPIDAQQLLYLVQQHHIPFPETSESFIWDKNKADGFARIVTLIQITWFLIQTLGRVYQRLGVSTLELSTLGFIFCTLHTFFFWRHKPLDVDTPVLLLCTRSIEDLRSHAGADPFSRCSETPLDFVKPPISRSSLLAPFWLGLDTLFAYRRRKRSWPVESFENWRTTPPRGMKIADLAFAVVFTFTFFSIHLAAWNFFFPSQTEQILWRVASVTLLGALVLYYVAIILGQLMAARMAKAFFGNEKETTIFGLAPLLPRWVAVLTHAPIAAIYVAARTYIIIEGFVSLRTLPRTAYDDVDWSRFVGG